MAVDFMVMPLSRYLSGDFVTPAMRTAWDSGSRYTIVTPSGARDLPPGEPFGGPDALARWARFVPVVRADVQDAAGGPWNEESQAEPCFHRPDARSYAALLEYCAAPPEGLALQPRHVGVSLFFPGDFLVPYKLDSPFPDRLIGSVPQALTELDQTSWPEAAQPAVATLRAALIDARRVHLPLVVDA